MDNENNMTKERLSMEGLWQESGGTASAETFRELVRMGNRIGKAERKKRGLRAAMYAAGVLSALAAVALVTFSLTRRSYEISPLECTRNIVAEYGKTSSVTLSDGTAININSGSTLLYPETFNAGSRVVFLTGEGNFSVAKDPKRPFTVKTAHMDIEALGTSFCVKSYVGEKTIRTTLKEGKVRVTIPSAGNKSYILEPDMQLVYTPSKKTVSIARVDAKKVMGWEDGFLSFTNASFPEIAAVLERRFDVSLNYDTEKMRQNALNVRFMPDETLDDVLNVLTLLLPGSRYKKDGERIFWEF